jgi:hypothetical protein
MLILPVPVALARNQSNILRGGHLPSFRCEQIETAHTWANTAVINI